MSIGFWNIRGGVRKNALEESRDFCVSNNINILTLCEVKSQIPPSQATASKAGFQYFDSIPTLGFGGGIWIFWKNCNKYPFSLSVIYKSLRFLACEISLLNLNIQYIAIFIYAPARKEWKLEFWKELIDYVNSLSLPFIILGDFNEISDVSDKMGGAQYNSSRSLVMQNLLSSVPGIEIAFIGQRFTWRKKKAGPNNILERLDRGVASSSWLGIFPQAKVKHHIFTSSDHCQMSLEYLPKENCKSPPFRFEKMWCSRKDYDVLVKKT